MNPSGLRLRRATEDDEAAILDLVRTSLGTGSIPRTAEYWRWKHRRSPFGASPTLVAEHAGRLVGLRTFLRWRWWSGTTRIPAVRAVDTATHPEYRGRHVFTRLTLRLRDEMDAEGVAFVFNTPNRRSRPGYKRMGWAAVGRPTVWVRPVRPWRGAGAIVRGRREAEARRPPSLAAPSVGEALSDPAILDVVAGGGVAEETRLHTRKDPAYLRWRYEEIPGLEYRALLKGRGADAALIVLRSCRRGPVRELRVCDVVVGSTRSARRNARDLLREAHRIGDVDVVVMMPPPGPGSTSLAVRSRFLPVPRIGPMMTAFPFSGSGAGPDPRDLSSWRASIGDLEVF